MLSNSEEHQQCNLNAMMGNRQNKVTTIESMNIANKKYAVNNETKPNNANSHEIQTDDYCLTTDSDYNKNFSDECECLLERPCTIVENEMPQELVDFEEMIDSQRTDKAKTLENLNEFENIFNCFDPSNIDENIINLDEIDDLFEEYTTGNENENSSSENTNLDGSNSQNVPNGHASECNIDVSVEIINNSMECNDIVDYIKNAQNYISKLDENVLKTKENDSIPSISGQSQKIVEMNLTVSNANISQTQENDVPTFNNTCENNIYADDLINEGNQTNMIIEDDIISISSEEIDDDGYNSSDFELISESEAYKDGFIINFRSNTNFNNSNNENVIGSNSDSSILDPGEGPSGLNLNDPRGYRQNHVIPEGEDYLNLFEFNQIIPIIDVLIMENKSIRPSPMNAMYDGLGFDNQLVVRRHHYDSCEEEYADEAKENVKMILSMYPEENRKRRRRF